MKKHHLLLILLTTGFLSHAQNKMETGVRAGINSSTFTNMEGSSSTGFYAGFYGELKITDTYALQPEFSFSRQGMNAKAKPYNIDGVQGIMEDQIHLNYFAVDILNKFNYNRINFHIGPTFDVLISSEDYINTGVDLGFTFGVGYQITDQIGIEGRYKKGLLDTIDSDYYYSMNNSRSNTNSVFQIGLTYTFKQ